MGSNLDARIWVGVPKDRQVFKEGLLEDYGICLEDYLDEDDPTGYEMYELIEAVNKKMKLSLDYSISYDSQDSHESIIGVCLTSSADWSPLEVDLDTVKVKEVEAELTLQNVFKACLEIKTYIVPSYC